MTKVRFQYLNDEFPVAAVWPAKKWNQWPLLIVPAGFTPELGRMYECTLSFESKRVQNRVNVNGHFCNVAYAAAYEQQSGGSLHDALKRAGIGGNALEQAFYKAETKVKKNRK